MTDSNLSTSPAASSLLLHRLEHELDAACDELERFSFANPGADVDAAVAPVDAIVRRIEEIPPQTLGDLRIQAKALQAHYGGDLDAGLFDLLLALERLPERLWEERIGKA
jgi:hypothetical protein